MTHFSKEDHDFLDFLFSKVAPIKHEIDLHDDDSCIDHHEFEKVHQFCFFEESTTLTCSLKMLPGLMSISTS
jgi:hypothetical protein